MQFLDKIVSTLTTHTTRNAFCIQDKFYTYADLASNISNIQEVFDGLFQNEQRIGVLINDNIETYSVILATLLSGRTYIPIHPGHPADRIEQIIAQAGLNVIFSATDAISYGGIHNVNTSVIIANTVASDAITAVQDAADKYAYILFTSGTTGVPKGTPITYHNLDSFTTAFFALGYDINEHDGFLQMFDLTFDLSVMSYLMPLCIGACVYTVPEKGMKFTNIYGLLEAHNITFALMVPSILSYLRPYFGEIELPLLRHSLFCGEALLTDVVKEWASCAPNAIIENVYGPTEATIFCLTYRVDPAAGVLDVNGIVSIGKEMQGTEAIVVDELMQPVHYGEKGELCLYGHQVTPGYLSDEKNKEAFFLLNDKKYYRTGDIAYMHESGNYIYCGRIDHQVKIQGFRVELSEVEHHVREIVNGTSAVALAVSNGNGLNQIDVIIESDLRDKEELLIALRTKLPPYMIPTNIHFISPFPLNVNGKTDRKALQLQIMESIEV